MKSFLRKIKHFIERKLKFYKRIGLKNKKAAIISNNCTGGYIYQHFGLEYYSPTAGLFFTGEDYVKLCKNVKYYFSKKLEFIPYKDSKNFELLSTSNRWGEYPVAKIDDIEVYFMHYKSEQEAASKWYRRISRVNYDNMVFLFAESEISTKADINAFCSLADVNKVCLTYNDYGGGTIFSKQVSCMEAPSWLPEIVLHIVDWKKVLNKLVENNE